MGLVNAAMVGEHIHLIVPNDLVIILVREHGGQLIAQGQTVGNVAQAVDDGEPSQTAGKPMLDVLTGAGLCDTVVVVTRYFGGTLLGTGGLVRAYTAAAKAGVEASEVIEKIPAVQFLVKVTYNQIGTLLYLLGQRGYSQLDSEYAEDVSVRFLVPLTERASMEKQLLESFQGSAKTEIEDYGYYAKNGKELLLFEEEV